MKMKNKESQQHPVTDEDDALYDRFVHALRSIREGHITQALDTVESVLRQSIRDLGPEATLPQIRFPAPAPITTAKPLLDLLVGRAVADGARVLMRVRSTVARKLEAMGGRVRVR